MLMRLFTGRQPRRPRVALVALLGVGLFGGAFAVLGWAPFAWAPLAILAFALLFYLLQLNLGVGASLSMGFAFGLGLHITGHGWMYETLRAKVGFGPFAAGLSTFAFAGYLALFTATPCALMGLAIGRSRWRGAAAHGAEVLCFAALLTLGEWLRSVLFNGFTSLSIGYVTLDTWLAGFAPIGGTYMAGFVALVLAGLPGCASRSRAAATGAGVVAVALIASGAALSRIAWAHTIGGPLSYRLVQSYVPQARKFDPRFAPEHGKHIVDLIVATPADIIATPETTFKSNSNEFPGDALNRIQRFSQQSASHIFLGVVMTAANSDGFNSIMQISPDLGAGTFARYDKVRLMPFGEYTPIGFSWFTDSLRIPLKDMSAGRGDQEPMKLSKYNTTVNIGTLICLEDMIGRDAVKWAGSANLLLNPTNLAWFDNPLAIDQRLQIARMRALEVARPILRIANTGISAQIDARGNIGARTSMGVEEVLSGTVQPTEGLTPYARLGDAPALVLCAIGVAPLAWRTRKRRRDRFSASPLPATDRAPPDQPAAPR